MAKKEKPRFDYNEELRRLKETGPERLYLLYGEEDYLREAFLDTLKERCLGGGEPDFNYRRLSGESVSPAELAEAVEAMPFLSERTLVEVRGYDINRCRDAELDQLKAIWSDIPDTCTVIFVLPSDYELDGRLSAVRGSAAVRLRP